MDEQQIESPLPPGRAEPSSGAIDPLAAKAAERIADVINGFKRDLQKRDSTCTHAQRLLELALRTSKTSNSTIVPDNECFVTAQTDPNSLVAVALGNHATTQTALVYKSARRTSDAELERDIVSRRKRKLQDGQDEPDKRPRTSEEKDDEDITPLITRDDLDDLFDKLREDIQEDTTEAINHVQRLLRRCKEKAHQQSKQAFQAPAHKLKEPLRTPMSAAGGGPVDSSSLPDDDCNGSDASIAQIVRQEADRISRQIKHVEDGRRAADDVHAKREDTWRTTSAGFHDQQRQDREKFQNHMMRESAMHSQMLNQILNEVKAVGLYAQNMKWETPNYLNQLPNGTPQVPTSHVFAPQTHTPSTIPKPPAKGQQLTWKTGRGPGTQNG